MSLTLFQVNWGMVPSVSFTSIIHTETNFSTNQKKKEAVERMANLWKNIGDTIRETAKTTVSMTMEKMGTLKEMSTATVGSLKGGAKAAKDRVSNLREVMVNLNARVWNLNGKTYRAKKLLGEGRFCQNPFIFD